MKQSLQTLQEFNFQLLSPNTPIEVYRIITKYAQKLSGADASSIFLHKQNGLVRVYTNVPKERRIQPHYHGFAIRTLSTGKPYVYSAKELQLFNREIRNTLHSIIVVPIKFHERKIGMITLQMKDGVKGKKNILESLEILAGAASLAIEKSELLYKLKKAVRARDLFISAASHELKTPITVVQLYTKSIADALKKHRPINHEWVDKINRHTELLTRVISDFLEAGSYSYQNIDLRYDLKPVDIVQLLQQIVETAKKMYPERSVTFQNDARKQETILADSGRITQLVNNLIDNAVKFSKPPKPINIHLSLTGLDVCIEIIDKGSGIKKQEMNFLFNRYYKGADGKSEGLGIGLYVSKLIAEKHEGMIQIFSKEKQGTKVSVFLPVTNGRGVH